MFLFHTTKFFCNFFLKNVFSLAFRPTFLSFLMQKASLSCSMLSLQMLPHPSTECLVSTDFLLVLRLGEGQCVAGGIAILVREDNHQVGAREELGDFLRQSFQSCLVRHRSLTSRDYNKHVVGGNLCSQLWHLVPMVHHRVVGTYLLMAVLDILIDESQSLAATMKDDAAI